VSGSVIRTVLTGKVDEQPLAGAMRRSLWRMARGIEPRGGRADRGGSVFGNGDLPGRAWPFGGAAKTDIQPYRTGRIHCWTVDLARASVAWTANSKAP
jgi:hypothetical protein